MPSIEAITLNEDQVDMLAEIFNMGMGQSVNAFSLLSGKEHEVLFEIPNVELIPKEDFLKKIQAHGQMGFVMQEYSGDLKGKALMYYPEVSSKELAKLLIGTDVPADKLDTLEMDALTEVGNIFINSALASFANLMENEVKTSIPKIVYQDKINEEVFEGNQYIVHLAAPFKIDHLKIEGKIAFILDNQSVLTLLDAIDRFMNQG